MKYKKGTKRGLLYICCGSSFWTGHSWTTIRQFAKTYYLREALPIILKRFSNKYPRPRMRLVSYFDKKAAKAAAARKAKKLIESHLQM